MNTTECPNHRNGGRGLCAYCNEPVSDPLPPCSCGYRGEQHAEDPCPDCGADDCVAPDGKDDGIFPVDAENKDEGAIGSPVVRAARRELAATGGLTPATISKLRDIAGHSADCPCCARPGGRPGFRGWAPAYVTMLPPTPRGVPFPQWDAEAHWAQEADELLDSLK